MSEAHPWLVVLALLLGIVLGAVFMRRIYAVVLRLTGASVGRAWAVILFWTAAVFIAAWLEAEFLFEAYMRFPGLTVGAASLLVFVIGLVTAPFFPRGYYSPSWPSVRRALEHAGATKSVARVLGLGMLPACFLAFLATLYPIVMLMDFHNIM